MGEGDISGFDFSIHFRSLRDHMTRLARWAVPVWRKLATITPQVGAAGGPVICNLGTPPQGYYWRLASVRAVGPSVIAVANINVDVYVAGQANPSPGSSSQLASTVPSVADWCFSSSTTTGAGASSGSLPVELAPGENEVQVNAGESVIVVLSGSGLTAGMALVVTGFALQYEGFDALSRV